MNKNNEFRCLIQGQVHSQPKLLRKLNLIISILAALVAVPVERIVEIKDLGIFFVNW